jgi:drug/metabolite transporter (DMT)-like permease
MFWLCVAARIIANSLSNVSQKILTREHASPLFVIGVTHFLLAIVCAPWMILDPPPADREFWINMGVCSVLALAANVLIVHALQQSDLSFLGPVNAYKSVVSLVPGILLLHEIPSPGSLIGVALILLGSYWIVARAESSTGLKTAAEFFSNRSVQFRLGGMVLSAVEAVFLKRALAASSPALTFAVWSCAGFVVFLGVALAAARRSIPGQTRILVGEFFTVASLATTTGIMQFSTLVLFGELSVASALALFQTSNVITVFLGRGIFREPHFVRRLVGSVVMTAGAIFIVLSR